MFMPGPPPGQPMGQPMTPLDQFGQPIGGMQQGLYPPIMPMNMPPGQPMPMPQASTSEVPSASPPAAVAADAPVTVQAETDTDRSAPKPPTSMPAKDPPAPRAAPAGPTTFSDEEGNLKLVNMVVKCPCCCCWSVLLVCIIMTVILGAVLGQDGGVPITEDNHQYDVFDVRSKAYDSYRLALEATDDARDLVQNEGLVEPIQSQTIDIVYWIYEAEQEGGMFSEKGLDDIRKAEWDIYLSDEKWKDFCQTIGHFAPDGSPLENPTLECRKPLSPMTIFFPIGTDTEPAFDEAVADEVMAALDNAETRNLYEQVAPCIERDLEPVCEAIEGVVEQEDIDAMIALKEKIDRITSKWTGKWTVANPPEKVSDPFKMAKFAAYMKDLPTRAGLVDFFFDKEFSKEKCNAQPPECVSQYTRTVLHFGGPRDGYERTTDREDDQEAEVKKYVKDDLLDAMKEVAKRGNSDETNTFYFMTQLIFDIFVEILIRDTISAIVSVLMVYFYLWYMLGSLFLASVGMLEILLSIPCAWCLFRVIFQIKYFAGLNMLTIFIVAAIGADDIFVFMDAYKQSAHQGAEVNRNLQTRMSWVWRKSGLAMAITSATTCCAFLCTCVSPIAGTRSFGIFAALVILWDYVLVMSLFCTAVIIYHNRFEREPACRIPGMCGCCTESCSCDNQKPSPTEQNLQSFHDGMGVEQDKITKFFSTQVTDFVLSLPGRIGIAVVAIAWLIPAIIFVAKLEPTKTAEQFLSSDHPLQYSITILNEEFPASAENPGLRTYFAWGIDTLDQGGVNQLFDDDNVGKVRFKEGFNFNPECQKKLLTACEKMRFGDRVPGFEGIDPLSEQLIKRDENGLYSVRCFVESFHAHAARKHEGSSPPVFVRDLSVEQTNGTVPLSQMKTAMTAYFEDPPKQLENWDLILENVGFDGNDVRWVSLEVENNELNQWSTLPEETVRDVYEGMLDLAEELDALVGDSCGASGVLMTDQHQKFVFMNNQRIYRTSAISGAVIGVAIAFVVLCLATRSLLLSFLSTLSILCTIMSVIGVVTMIGWTLGTVEAILISILAGFSVDYVVHLAHAYAQSFGTAHERLRHAFSEMGTPVLSGMITSVLASLPLFFCEIVFFAKFGAFLCFTILFSWLFANFVFMSALATIGPSREKSQDAEGTSGQDKGHGAVANT